MNAKQVFTEKWIGHGECVPPIPKWQSPFYRAKAFICLALNLQPHNCADLFNSGLTVVYTNGGTSYVPGEPTVYWFEEIVVGYGCFRNWWATYNQDSN